MYVLHCDLDSFYASVEQALRPELQGKAVAISAARGQKVIIASSYEAKKVGIKVGVPLYQAFQIEPELHFLKARMEAYEAVSQKFFQLISELVTNYQSLGPDECFINSNQIPAHFGDEPEARIHTFAIFLKAKVKQLLGINLTIGGASNKVIAKLASDRAKPDGLLLLNESQERIFLLNSPVEDVAGIGAALEKKLKNAGIYKMKDGLSLSKSNCVRLLGKYHGKWFYDLINFSYYEDVVPNPLSRSISVMRSLGLQGESAVGAMEKLLPELGLKLYNQKLATRTISVFASTSTHIFQDSCDFKAPIGDYKLITYQIRKLFEQLPLNLKITYIGIALDKLSTFEQLPLDFYYDSLEGALLTQPLLNNFLTAEEILLTKAYYNMRVEHPRFGVGNIKALSGNCLEIDFNQDIKLLEPWAPLIII